VAATDLWSSTRFTLWAEVTLLDLANALGDANAISAILGTSLLPKTQSTKLSALVTQALQTGLLTLLGNIVIPLDVVHASTHFGVSEIPGCVLSLALGRRMDDPSIVSVSTFLSQSLKSQIHMKVWATAQATSGRADDWPTNPDGTPRPFMIFDGLTVQAGFRTMFGAAEYTVFLTHWLADLNFSSILSRSSSPANVPDLSYDAAMGFWMNPSAGFVDGAVSAAQATMGLASVVGADFWGLSLNATQKVNVFGITVFGGISQGGLKAFLQMVSSVDRFNWRLLQQRAGTNLCPTTGLPPQSNAEALAALARFEPFGGQAGGMAALQTALLDFQGNWLQLAPAQQQLLLNDAGYTYGVPLPLGADTALPQHSSNIARAVSAETPRTLANTTLWDRLVGVYAPEFAFAVVPMVDRALVVPFTPGLRTVWKTITAQEYSEFEHAVTTPRPIRGVALLMDYQLANGGAVNGGALRNLPAGGAVYDTCRDGLVLLKRGPGWLASVVFPTGDAPTKATGETQTNKSGKGNGAAGNNSVVPDPLGTLATNYCRALYLQEVLRHRQVRLTGRVRFDVAPGSSLAIEVVNEPFVNALAAQVTGKPAGPSYLYGTVLRVSTHLNAETQQAATNFQLGFVRDGAENADDSTSTNAHPVWRLPWTGAPLCAEPEFNP
jgi:hypothetical protein